MAKGLNKSRGNESIPEFLILYEILDYMESEGATYNVVRITIDDKYAKEINNKYKKQFTVEELQKAADKCKAHGWLKHTCMNGKKYAQLGITSKGVGAARSKQISKEHLNSRGVPKKFSDFIEDHKGLFLLLGFIAAIITLYLRLTGKS